MPVKVEKTNGYRVTHGRKVSAKKTSKKKAMAQARLLNAVEHTDWRPTKKKTKKG